MKLNFVPLPQAQTCNLECDRFLQNSRELFCKHSVERIICSIFFFTGKFEFKYNAIVKFSEEYFEMISYFLPLP